MPFSNWGRSKAQMPNKEVDQLSETSDDVERYTSVSLQPSEETASLSREHQEYLIKRHGTLTLDPVPGFGSADPYNWPRWKKVFNLVLVAIHAMMGTLTAGSIIPAYPQIAKEFHITLPEASYLTSLQIALLGAAPLFWKPLSNKWGRRPIFLISLIVSLVGNIGCAKSPSYSTMAVCRAIVAFFISSAGALGGVVVAESFFSHERARYMGIWTLLVTCGIPVGPVAFGFVAERLGYRWIYWILAAVNGAQFILYLFFGPETRYLDRSSKQDTSSIKKEYFNFFVTRLDPKPMKAIDFIQPLFLARRLYILIPGAAYAMIFLFATVLTTVEIPQLFEKKFGFNAEQLGLQFVAAVIGGVIGEQFGGISSDIWMTRRAKRIGRKPAPEYRLWLSYLGFTLAIVGIIVFLVQLQAAPDGHWNITPLIGVALAAAGNQIVTTVLITYSVDSLDKEEAAGVGVFLTFARQIWGFIGPFWFPSLFENVGVAASAGVATALMLGISVVPTILLHWKGKSWRTSP